MATNNELATWEELQGLPDLPALESVETTDYDGAFFLIYGGGIVLPVFLMMALSFWRIRQFIDTPGCVASGVFLLLCCWVVARIVTGYFSHQTSRDGIAMRGVLGRRRLPWTDIRGARTSQTQTGQTVITLDTNSGAVRILPRGMGTGLRSGDTVAASVWQHLRQIGRADDMALPRSALGFWEQIPEDVPADIEWGKPPSRGTAIAPTIVTVIFLAMAASPWLMFGISVKGLMMFSMLGPMTLVLLFGLFLPEMTRKAHWVSLSDSHIEAKLARKSVSFAWSDVTLADWRRNYLRIRFGRTRDEIWVPYVPGDKESEALILATIRELRTAGVPQAIAPPLLISKHPEELSRSTLSSERQGAIRRAFINTLDPPARKVIGRLWALQIWLLVFGIIAGAAIAFGDIVGWLSRCFHASLGTRYFIIMDTIPLAIGFMPLGIVFSGLLAQWIGNCLSGAYRAEWDRFQRVGSSTRFQKAATVGFVVWIVGSVAGTALMFDCYTRVTEDGIAINRCCKFREQFYGWSQVRSVEDRQRTTNHEGHTCVNNTYCVRFVDGASWRFDETNVRVSRREELGQAIKFIAMRSGKSAKLIYQAD